MHCIHIVLLAEIASKHINTIVVVTGSVNLPVMLQCANAHANGAEVGGSSSAEIPQRDVDAKAEASSARSMRRSERAPASKTGWRTCGKLPTAFRRKL